MLKDKPAVANAVRPVEAIGQVNESCGYLRRKAQEVLCGVELPPDYRIPDRKALHFYCSVLASEVAGD